MSNMDEFLHEAQDRAHMVSQHLQMALEEHPAVVAHEDIQQSYAAAVTAVEALYQQIGQSFEETVRQSEIGG